MNQIGYIITDPQLGEICVQTHARARRIIFHLRADGAHLTVPPNTSFDTIQQVVDQYRQKLLEHIEQSKRTLIEPGFRLDAPHFTFELVQGTGCRYEASALPRGLRLACPPHTSFADNSTQTWLRKVIGEALRTRAKAYLPARLAQLAALHGLTYAGVKIQSSKRRWGSCSSARQINLSYGLMLLPDSLIDYVLLHELAHTVEMSHGSRFHALLNRLCGGAEESLRAELRKHTIEF